MIIMDVHFFFFQLESCAKDKNTVRFGPRTENSNQQKLYESFVAYSNRKSIPMQDMVYTRKPKPYADIESIV